MNISGLSLFFEKSKTLFATKDEIKGLKGDKGDLGIQGVSISKVEQTATSTSDVGINTSTWNIYQCTTAGAASTAKWAYKGNIKGANATTTAVATTSANGLMRKEMVQKLGAIDGITSDINSESDTIAASSKMVHDLNSSLSNLFTTATGSTQYSVAAYGATAIHIYPAIPSGYVAIGVAGFNTGSTNILPFIVSNNRIDVQNAGGSAITLTATITVLCVKNL